MARNIEIKAWVDDRPALEARAAAIADSGPVSIPQDDTFFRCAAAGDRLKLRVYADGTGQLIHYRRPDHDGPKESVYLLSPTAEPDSLREVLVRAHGEAGRVRKQRTLYLVGRTRVHLDLVEGLGELMELEVVLRDDEPAEAGEREARALMARLGIDEGSLVRGAYVDLLRDRAAAGQPR